MKNIMQLFVALLPWLLLLFTSSGFCQQVHCQWGPYGDWSECDGCTKLQTRSRTMNVYAQFNGNPCDGQQTETRSCQTTKSCPLEEGCGNRFRCRSGKCVSLSLKCNGDQDCEEDGLDEAGCSEQSHFVCDRSAPPPNIELLGLGVDLVTGKKRGTVINTKSFGGQCNTIFSGVNQRTYRLPVSTIQYNFMVKAQNDFSDEMYHSEWHYAHDIVKRQKISGTTTGYRNYDYHEKHDKTQTQKLVILKNEIEITQFQSNAPRYIPISEEFWKALSKLPSVYDYAAYRQVLERFGTHYVSEGSLGGSFNVIAKVDEETEKLMIREREEHQECERTKRWILFFPITRTVCRKDPARPNIDKDLDEFRKNNPFKVTVVGGGTSQIAALQRLEVSTADKNWETYANWADSVGSFPQIIKQKFRPLSELVKEVQCAAVKRHYLRRAIEQYVSESDPCHCRPCSNNGLAVINDYRCKCVCKPGTEGLACEQGAEIEGQPGVIHGSWSCWSAWSSCSGGRKSRSRACSNPYPQNSGQHCIGESAESSECEDDDLKYLKTMEPQCFDQTLPASEKCETPPALINGYVLDPKDIYLVGNKVQYTCIEGFHLSGPSTIECTGDKVWSASLGVCKASRCKIQSLGDGVIASPLKPSYNIGEFITLSCPAGKQLRGEARVTCNPSLVFSPDPTTVSCNSVVRPEGTVSPPLQCKVWEKLVKGKCICKLPSECPSSLELCSSVPGTTRSFLVTVCKMHAMRCAGRDPVVAEDGACQWPARSSAGCAACHMWETCDDQTHACRCKDAAECSAPGLNVCVRVGQNVTAEQRTMGECEAGRRRCNGEAVSVVSIFPCAT
ncbi:complement component C7 [Betta splendens]|uniref:Complement component C7 n=1 Tax=Betta splendens TaxID=158456 RepID=A0A6P7NFU2_BETSP|nr:complement component C7 [Betta splendens]